MLETVVALVASIIATAMAVLVAVIDVRSGRPGRSRIEEVAFALLPVLALAGLVWWVQLG
ncbi:MAG: hypothetical protein HKN07_12140 [Acidimicrobiia bacterium]|nr:hypothetical protein [Acidimicrobiia bacterium]NNF64989.1 hypothetical protein [Acidimicrobiia bacterium]